MKEVELERAFVSVICVCAVGDEERGEREVSGRDNGRPPELYNGDRESVCEGRFGWLY